MGASDRYADRHGHPTNPRAEHKKKFESRPAVGLTIPFKGWMPSKSVQNTRVKYAAEAGFSSRETYDIIKTAPFMFDKTRWKEVRDSRYDKVVQYCEEMDWKVPSPDDWKIRRLDDRDLSWADLSKKLNRIQKMFPGWTKDRYESTLKDIKKRLDVWEDAAQRVDEMYGHMTIFDIFYEDKEGSINT